MMRSTRSRFVLTTLCFGYAFLYIPMAILVIYSFNESRIVTVWSGFSTKWYKALFHNEALLNGAWVSFKVAALTATFAVILGTLAAIVLVRFHHFKGRTLFQGLMTAPMILPDVIMGLAFLMLFVSLKSVIGFPESRGVVTIILSHITLSVAYVILIIKNRLLEFDRSLEEAALDLGARPLTVFWQITLPIISPSLGASWFLAFTLSLDDLVLASFTSGPGSSTLPMVVFSNIRTGLTPQINALGTIIISLVAFGILISGIILYRKSRRELS